MRLKKAAVRCVFALVCLYSLALHADNPKRPAALADLPLIVLPQESATDTFAVVVSGDGGWASIDRALAKHLFGKGVPVVGVNSLSYFWDAKTPAQISKDLDRIITYFLSAWHKKKVLVMGYSMGADVIPFMVSRLPASTLATVNGIAMIAPAENANFEFHVTQWFTSSADKKGLPILPEMDKISGVHVVCIGGDREHNSLCLQLEEEKPRRANVDVEMMEGGHHFTGDYKEVVQLIGKKFQLE